MTHQRRLPTNSALIARGAIYLGVLDVIFYCTLCIFIMKLNVLRALTLRAYDILRHHNYLQSEINAPRPESEWKLQPNDCHLFHRNRQLPNKPAFITNDNNFVNGWSLCTYSLLLSAALISNL